MDESERGLTFEHEMTRDGYAAQMRWMFNRSSMFDRVIRKRNFLSTLIWIPATGILAHIAARLSGLSPDLALPAAALAALLFLVFRLVSLSVPSMAAKNRARWEKVHMKYWLRTCLKDKSVYPTGQWRYTITPEALEYEDMTRGNTGMTKMSGITQADLVDGHLCLSADGMLSGSIPLAGIETDEDREVLRTILLDAGVRGWPEGDPGFPPAAHRRTG